MKLAKYFTVIALGMSVIGYAVSEASMGWLDKFHERKNASKALADTAGNADYFRRQAAIPKPAGLNIYDSYNWTSLNVQKKIKSDVCDIRRDSLSNDLKSDESVNTLRGAIARTRAACE